MPHGLYNRRISVPLDVARAVEMYLDGFTPAEIASELLLIKSSSRVVKGLREAGVWQVPIFKAQHQAARNRIMDLGTAKASREAGPGTAAK